jgi:hypothetical protein
MVFKSICLTRSFALGAEENLPLTQKLQLELELLRYYL